MSESDLIDYFTEEGLDALNEVVDLLFSRNVCVPGAPREGVMQDVMRRAQRGELAGLLRSGGVADADLKADTLRAYVDSAEEIAHRAVLPEQRDCVKPDPDQLESPVAAGTYALFALRVLCPATNTLPVLHRTFARTRPPDWLPLVTVAPSQRLASTGPDASTEVVRKEGAGSGDDTEAEGSPPRDADVYRAQARRIRDEDLPRLRLQAAKILDLVIQATTDGNHAVADRLDATWKAVKEDEQRLTREADMLDDRADRHREAAGMFAPLARCTRSSDTHQPQRNLRQLRTN